MLGYSEDETVKKNSNDCLPVDRAFLELAWCLCILRRGVLRRPQISGEVLGAQLPTLGL